MRCSSVGMLVHEKMEADLAAFQLDVGPHLAGQTDDGEAFIVIQHAAQHGHHFATVLSPQVEVHEDEVRPLGPGARLCSPQSP
jgi:hypothetical protein